MTLLSGGPAVYLHHVNHFNVYKVFSPPLSFCHTHVTPIWGESEERERNTIQWLHTAKEDFHTRLCDLKRLKDIMLFLDYFSHMFSSAPASLSPCCIHRSISLSKNLALSLMFLLVRDKGILRLEDLAGSTTCRQYFNPSI